MAQPETEPTVRSVRLTRAECLFISDQLNIFSPWPGIEDDAHWLKRVVVKVMEGFHDCPPDEAVVIGFEDMELWIIREVAKSTVMRGQEPIGLQLFTKVSAALLGEVTQQLARLDAEEPEYEGVQEKLDSLKKGGRRRARRTDKGPSEDPDQSPGDGAVAPV